MTAKQQCVVYFLIYCNRYFFRLVVYAEGEIVVDTGYIIDKTLKGGKVGMYVFSQGQVLWKNLSYRCSGKCRCKCLGTHARTHLRFHSVANVSAKAVNSIVPFT